jgi:hypothetical protein
LFFKKLFRRQLLEWLSDEVFETEKEARFFKEEISETVDPIRRRSLKRKKRECLGYMYYLQRAIEFLEDGILHA